MTKNVYKFSKIRLSPKEERNDSKCPFGFLTFIFIFYFLFKRFYWNYKATCVFSALLDFSENLFFSPNGHFLGFLAFHVFDFELFSGA